MDDSDRVDHRPLVGVSIVFLEKMGENVFYRVLLR